MENGQFDGSTSANAPTGPLDNRQIAERMGEQIVWMIQPSVVSEESRRAVVQHLQRLIKGLLGAEVFHFGSVPLKTYLTDGDIDLTAFVEPNSMENFANELCKLLEEEAKNKDSAFDVRHIHYINAEVKLVKCLVGDLVIDISFNQVGGLRALCFLEKVNMFIGKDHLFKRTVILVKAWCFYESRILGAHHSLISTYAVEVLVLYIFHLFHSSLDGPLSVLYKFLEYFSQFDWNSYGISLRGRVRLCALPDIVVEPPDNNGTSLLFSNEFFRICGYEFLDACDQILGMDPRMFENDDRPFTRKAFNIVDPLKENNNVGRSVSPSNLCRIRNAFSLGAKRIQEVFLSSGKRMEKKLKKFFEDTLQRHEKRKRADVKHPLLPSLRATEPLGFRELSEMLPEVSPNTHTFDQSITAAYNQILSSPAIAKSFSEISAENRPSLRDMNAIYEPTWSTLNLYRAYLCPVSQLDLNANQQHWMPLPTSQCYKNRNWNSLPGRSSRPILETPVTESNQKNNYFPQWCGDHVANEAFHGTTLYPPSNLGDGNGFTFSPLPVGVGIGNFRKCRGTGTYLPPMPQKELSTRKTGKCPPGTRHPRFQSKVEEVGPTRNNSTDPRFHEELPPLPSPRAISVSNGNNTKMPNNLGTSLHVSLVSETKSDIRTSEQLIQNDTPVSTMTLVTTQNYSIVSTATLVTTQNDTPEEAIVVDSISYSSMVTNPLTPPRIASPKSPEVPYELKDNSDFPPLAGQNLSTIPKLQRTAWETKSNWFSPFKQAGSISADPNV